MSMQVAQIDGYGPPERVFSLGERDVPIPNGGQVRVKLDYTSVNPIDCARREGYGDAVFRRRGAAGFPLVLGCDLSGTIDAVGAGVSAFVVGTPVFGAIDPSRAGTYATHCIVPATALIPRPAGLAPEHAAALPYAFLTAWRGLIDQLGLEKDASGRRVMILGAAGGVGTLAVQLARSRGARVIAGASPAHHQGCLDRGAETVFDYRVERYPPADLIFRCGGGDDEERRCLAALAPGGSYVTTIHPLLSLIDRHGLVAGGTTAAVLLGRRKLAARLKDRSYGWVLFRRSGDGLSALADLAGSGRVQPVIGACYPLTNIALAHRRQEAGHFGGKIVIDCRRAIGMPD